MLLHDLRFVIEGEVTQIDHLIPNRTGSIYLLETMNYACNLVINDRREFTAEYENARFGIPSPVEQSMRHERVLRQLPERLDIVGRTRKHPDFHHVVNAPSQGDDRAAPGQKLCGKSRHRHAFQKRAEQAQPGDNHRVGRKAQKAAPPDRLADAARLYTATRVDQSGADSAFVVAVSAQIHRPCPCAGAGAACKTGQTPGLRPMRCQDQLC